VGARIKARSISRSTRCLRVPVPQARVWELGASIGVHYTTFDAKLSGTVDTRRNGIGQAFGRCGPRRAAAVIGLHGTWGSATTVLDATAQFFSLSIDQYSGNLQDYRVGSCGNRSPGSASASATTSSSGRRRGHLGLQGRPGLEVRRSDDLLQRHVLTPAVSPGRLSRADPPSPASRARTSGRVTSSAPARP